MKAGIPLFLFLSLSLVLLIPRLTQAFWKIPIKKPNLDTKVLAQLDTFTSDATKSLEEMNKSVYAMVKQRRQSICCYDVVSQEDKQSLSLRSAIYTTIVALSRLQDAASEYRQQLNQNCGKCDVPPGEDLCNAEDYPCPSEPEKCINGSQLCDGKLDCIDGSDEKFENCYKNPCEYDAICEENQLCIPSSYRCDGRWDCPDGSDETVCVVPNTQCEDDQFKCVSGDRCVPTDRRCDGEKDCWDGSDEAFCTTTSPIINPSVPDTCRDDQFKCVSNDTCVPTEYRCDGVEDCSDGSDEASCQSPDPCNGQFKCVSDDTCVSATWRCDGEEDCSDGSDEVSCPNSATTTTPSTPTTTTTNCRDGQFKCVSDDTCVSATWRCDGEKDCSDGSDEASCQSPNRCRDGQFKCVSDDTCVSATWRCDGEEDCSDGSDEVSCPNSATTTTPSTPTTTTTNVRVEPCEENPCSHRCEPATWTNQGFFCTCPEGMELQLPDGHNCVATGRKGIKGAISGTKGIKG